MALMKSKHVPEDAIIISELEAKEYAWELVSNWKNTWDKWALVYGPGILGAVNAVSGLIINGHYRNKLKLGTYGYLASVVPITAIPGVLTALFHRHAVATDMLLMKSYTCPLCYELRSALIQSSLGLAYPMVLGPASALMLAHRYGTYRTPNLGEGPRVMFQFLRKITRPFNGTLAFLFTFQLVASSAVTYFEMRNNLTLRRKVTELENKLLAKEMHGQLED